MSVCVQSRARARKYVEKWSNLLIDFKLAADSVCRNRPTKLIGPTGYGHASFMRGGD